MSMTIEDLIRNHFPSFVRKAFHYDHGGKKLGPEPYIDHLCFELALLWQIYSRRRSLQIHFLQCGHRCGCSRAMSSRIAWRTAGKLG